MEGKEFKMENRIKVEKEDRYGKNDQPWRLIDTGSHSAAINMAMDEAIARMHREGRVPPTLRFYTWEKPTLSIGYFQRAKEEIDLERVREANLDFVRRPTGGRAVLHDRELTYSIVVLEATPYIPPTVTESYRFFSEGLLRGFRRLGIDAQMVRHGPEEGARDALKTAACFDSPSWYELVLGDRKIAGSAQVRSNGVILQHGSILIDLDAELLFSVLRFSTEEVRQRAKRLFLRKAVAINEERKNAPATLDQVKDAFRHGFEEGLKIHLVKGELTEEERILAEKIAREKYEKAAWNLRR